MFQNVIFPILGLIVSIALPLYVNAQRHPRQQVRYHVEQSPITPPASAKPHLGAIGLEGVDLVKVAITLWASGRADIPSAAFDDGRPLVFEFISPIADSVLEKKKFDIEGWGFSRVGLSQIVLNPCLIGRGIEFKSQVVVAAPGEYRMRHPLTDIEVIRDPNLPKLPTANRFHFRVRITALRVGVAITILGFLLSVIGTIVSAASTTAGLGLIVAGYFIVFPGLIVVAIAAIIRLVTFLSHRRPREKSGIPDPSEPPVVS
jgi:hypothetical protein